MKKLLGGSLLLLVGILLGMGIMVSFSTPETVEVIKYVTEKEFVEVSVPLSEIVPGTNEDAIQIRIYDGNLQVKINSRWKNFGTLKELSMNDPLALERPEAVTKLEEIMDEKKAQTEIESGKSYTKADYTKPVFSSNAKKGEVKKETVKKTETTPAQPADSGNSGGTAAENSSGGSSGNGSGGNSGGSSDGGSSGSGAGGAGGDGNSGSESNSGDTDKEWSGDLE